MPVYGRLGDVLGRRPVIVVALVLVVVGSVIGGLAPNMATVIVARAIQGMGAGGLLILIQAVIADLVQARERLRYLGGIDVVFAVAAVLGPVLGGWLAEGAGWRWAFWLNLPLGAVAIAAAAWWMPQCPEVRGDQPKLVLDVRGSVALAAAVVAVVLLASWGGTWLRWTSPVKILLSAALVISVVILIDRERRARQPVIPLSLFGQRNFAVAAASGAILAAAVFGTVGYLQMGMGLTPSRAGMMMLSLVVGLGLMTVVAAKLVRRTGHYRVLIVAGAVTVTAGLATLSTMTPQTPLPAVGLYLFCLGAGTGCAWEPLVVVAQTAVTSDRTGTATAVNGFSRELGVAVGTALVGAMFVTRLMTQAVASGRGGAAIDAGSLTPARVALLPDDQQQLVATAYADALTSSFTTMVRAVALAAVGLCFLKPHELAHSLPTPTEAVTAASDLPAVAVDSSDTARSIAPDAPAGQPCARSADDR